jgi:O-antigen/teichoic acid export membrane protein
MSKFPDKKDQYTSSMQGLTSLITAIIFMAYIVLHSVINTFTELTTLITVAMFLELFVAPAISFWTIRQRYDFQYKSVVLVTLFMSICNPVIGVVAVSLTEDKGNARILSCILVQVCFGVVFYIHNLRKGKEFYNPEFWKFAMAFNLPLLPHYFSSYIIDQSDRIMIQKISGLEAVAFYSIAYNAGAVIKIVTSSITNAMIPWQYRKMDEKDYHSIRKIMNIIFIFVALVVLVFSAFAPELMLILGGSNYYEAIYVVPPISSSLFFIFVYGIFANIEFYYDENKFVMFISMITAGLNLILNALFIPIFGYVAASYTTLFSYSVLCISHAFFTNFVSQKKFGSIIYPFKNIILMSVFIVAATIVMNLVYLNFIVRYSLIGVALVVTIIFRKKIYAIIKVLK